MRSGSLASAVATNAGLGTGGALRHRCKVITLTPSARAISLCNLPCVANPFACASLLAISALECLFLSAIVVSLPPLCCRSPDCIRPPHVNLTQISLRVALTGYHLRAKINMGYVWDGCAGTECENVCAQRRPIANWSSRFVTKFSTIQLTAQ